MVQSHSFLSKKQAFAVLVLLVINSALYADAQVHHQVKDHARRSHASDPKIAGHARIPHAHKASSHHGKVTKAPATGPLSTFGNQIIAADGTKVRIQGVSWFGAETSNFVPHGLWTRGYKSMMDQMKASGFNAIRLPFSNQLFDAGSTPNSIDFTQNPDLQGLTGLQIIDKIVEYADQIGLWIMLDHHRSEAGNSAEGSGLWYTDQYPLSRYTSDWLMLVNRYINNPSVVAVDVHNEPHGPARWNSNDANDWARAAQTIGNAILAVNPNLLIVIEGVEQYNNQFYWWGGNLMGVKDFQVQLNVPNKVVYSPHDYPNSVYQQTWFSAANFPSNLPGVFHNAWGYIYENNIAPVIVGEFGSKLVDPKDVAWWQKIVAYMNGDFTGSGSSTITGNNQGISWFLWSWNPDSGDTGGYLEDDWKTPDPVKVQALVPLFSGPQTGNNGTGTGVNDNGNGNNNNGNNGTGNNTTPDQFINQIQVLYQDLSTAATGYQIKAGLQLVNTSTYDASYSDLAVRYWFVKPAGTQLQYWVDWNKFGCPYIVNGNFTALFNPVASANNYLELTFTQAAGVLAAQSTSDQLAFTIRSNDCSVTFPQSNDYSYNGSDKQPTLNGNITVYHKGVLVAGTEPTPAGPVNNGSCSVVYSVTDQWNNGFIASVTINNPSATAINGWTLQFTFPNGQTIANLWNGVLSANGSAITVTNQPYNAIIPAGGSVNFGFQGSYASTNNVPTTFNVNNSQCAGGQVAA